MAWRQKQAFGGRVFEISSKVLGSGAQGEVRLARAEDDHGVKAIVKTMQPTADLATRRLDIHEKNAWMLRSHLE